MGKYLFIMICAFLSSLAGKVSAQRYLPGQTGLELTMGGVDDFAGNVKRLRGNFQVGLALSCYNRNRSRWVFGADYVKKHYAYKKIAVPKEQFTAEAGCLFPFLSDRGRNVFLSAGLSALAGYERVNRNGRLLYDGATCSTRVLSSTVSPRHSGRRRTLRTAGLFFSMSGSVSSSAHP